MGSTRQQRDNIDRQVFDLIQSGKAKKRKRIIRMIKRPRDMPGKIEIIIYWSLQRLKQKGDIYCTNKSWELAE